MEKARGIVGLDIPIMIIWCPSRHCKHCMFSQHCQAKHSDSAKDISLIGLNESFVKQADELRDAYNELIKEIWPLRQDKLITDIGKASG